MAPFQIMEIWRCLSLPGSTLAQDIADAVEAARDPEKSVLSCPWNHCTGRYFKARRVAWRVAFRLQRERGEVPFITNKQRAA